MDDDSNKTSDEKIEAVVLAQLLVLHPTLVTMAELIREIAGEEPSFAERDAIERAVRDLVAVGLVTRSEELVMPTRAALRFDELSDS